MWMTFVFCLDLHLDCKLCYPCAPLLLQNINWSFNPSKTNCVWFAMGEARWTSSLPLPALFPDGHQIDLLTIGNILDTPSVQT